MKEYKLVVYKDKVLIYEGEEKRAFARVLKKEGGAFVGGFIAGAIGWEAESDTWSSE